MHGDPMLGNSTIEQFCLQFNILPTDEHPHLKMQPGILEEAKKILRKKQIDPASFITIHVGPSLPVKEWPNENWIKLVALLRNEGFANIIQVGTGHYVKFGRVAVEAVPGAVSLMNELSVEESLAVIALARLHVGIDSGPLHIAAMVGTPAVGLFGMTSPQLLFSKTIRRHFVVSQVACQGCGHYLAATPYSTDCPQHIQCMKEISPEEVLRACLAFLKPAVP